MVVKAWRRLTLRRSDGQVYMDRWGFRFLRLGGVYVHRFTAPDPGLDLHDHPWWFASLILKGGYTEERASIRDASSIAYVADLFPESCRRGEHRFRGAGSLRTCRLDEAHRVVRIHGKAVWSLVLIGPVRRHRWGFYSADGWVPEGFYRGERGLLVEENARG